MGLAIGRSGIGVRVHISLRNRSSCWLPEFEIVSVRDHDARLSRDFEDWQVILGCSQSGAEGFISDDYGMLDNPRVIAVVEQIRMTLVVCAGDDRGG
jgi:hypothetical protein